MTYRKENPRVFNIFAEDCHSKVEKYDEARLRTEAFREGNVFPRKRGVSIDEKGHFSQIGAL